MPSVFLPTGWINGVCVAPGHGTSPRSGLGARTFFRLGAHGMAIMACRVRTARREALVLRRRLGSGGRDHCHHARYELCHPDLGGDRGADWWLLDSAIP